MLGIYQMVLWLNGLLLDYFDPQKKLKWWVEIMGRYNGFLWLKMNILSIQSVFFFLYPILLKQQYVHVPFFMEKNYSGC